MSVKIPSYGLRGGTALVFAESDTVYNWWCPRCTPEDGPLVQGVNYAGKPNALKAASRHDKENHSV